MRLFILISILLLGMPAYSFAEDNNSSITLTYVERPTAINGYTLKYGPPYETVKLAGVAIPENDNAKMFLEMALKQTKTYPLEIKLIESPNNRYSTAYAVVTPQSSGFSLQKELILGGLTRFFPFGLDNKSPLNKELQMAERFARDTKRGIWAKDNVILKADDIYSLKANNKMALVTGVIVETSVTNDMTYINFGSDIKTDFTIMIPKDVWAQFPQDTVKLLEMPTVKVLVRGIMSSYNGPMIKVNHPAQIEILP